MQCSLKLPDRNCSIFAALDGKKTSTTICTLHTCKIQYGAGEGYAMSDEMDDQVSDAEVEPAMVEEAPTAVARGDGWFHAITTSTPWWLISVVFHVLMILLAAVVSSAIEMPDNSEPLVTVSALVRPTGPDEKKPRSKSKVPWLPSAIPIPLIQLQKKHPSLKYRPTSWRRLNWAIILKRSTLTGRTRTAHLGIPMRTCFTA